MPETRSPNLVEGILEECKRARELADVYKTLGPRGAFALAFIRDAIDSAERALGSGDVVAMLAALTKLRGLE
jgi:hypothetical protein